MHKTVAWERAAVRHRLPIGASHASRCQHKQTPCPLAKRRGFIPARASSMQPSFDAAAYDAERLRLDDQARQGMVKQMQGDEEANAKLPGSKEGAWKWALRKKMWDYMEKNDIARFPRPVHHRIPNFKDAEAAANRLANLAEFEGAQCIKVNPDTPQKQVRYRTLSSGKVLLVPQPRLRTGFFSELLASNVPEGALGEACTNAGVVKYGRPLSLFSKIKVDLVVVGSSCVSRNGARLGKGEGFAELEYGILRWMGAIDEHTLVVTTVHDCQVLEDEISPELLLEHDVPVDIIVTPTKVIYTKTSIPKPSGILWHKLSPEKLGQIRVLQELKEHIEAETGQKLPAGPNEVLPPTASRKQQKWHGKNGKWRSKPTKQSPPQPLSG